MQGSEITLAMPARRSTEVAIQHGPEEVWWMAERVARSGLFPGAKTPEQAFTLMLIAAARGLHPIDAVLRYDVIENRPSMKAKAVLAEFQARGGKVRWIVSTPDVAEAEFCHPVHHPEPFVVRMELSRFVENKVAMTFDEKSRNWVLKRNWQNWPDAMLRARCITAGVNAIDPGTTVGIDSEDEAEDIAAMLRRETPAEMHYLENARAIQAIAAEDHRVPGQMFGPLDQRPYLKLAADACAATNADVRKLHAHLLTTAAALGHIDGPVPTKLAQGIKALADVYLMQRQWLRREVADWCEANAGSAEPAHVEVEAVARGAEWEPGADG